MVKKLFFIGDTVCRGDKEDWKGTLHEADIAALSELVSVVKRHHEGHATDDDLDAAHEKYNPSGDKFNHDKWHVVNIVVLDMITDEEKTAHLAKVEALLKRGEACSNVTEESVIGIGATKTAAKKAFVDAARDDDADDDDATDW